jgi:radical SAM superfamily enzyme YgiQ (UPF0313 family)
VAATLRAAGFRVDVVDYEYLHRAQNRGLDGSNWLEAMCEPILELNPLVIGLTVLADTLPTCLLMGQYFKHRFPQVPIVFGGPGLYGCVPQVLNRYGDCLDYACLNEGELCMVDLCQRLAEGETLPLVQGFQMVREKQVLDGGRRPLADLNQLPSPAYDLVEVNSYLELASPRIFDIYLGSGCTYACQFCVTAPFWEKKFRAKNPKTVLSELDTLNAKYGIQKFNFLHDNFANSKEYLNNFIDYFKEFNHRYEWGCAVRPDNVTRDQLSRMRAAGCFNVFCGTDSGSTNILRAMKKMPNAQRSYLFFSNCQEVGLQFETNTIIGYPNETDDDLEESLDMVFASVAYGAVNSDVSVLQPLPGAPVTLNNKENLEFVEVQSLGTFLPSEVIKLAREDKELFSGFYFIQNKNREFLWYVKATDFVRFFTRHWFRTTYFLVKYCGISYVELFNKMESVRYSSELNSCFKSVFSTLKCPSQYANLAQSVFKYDEVEESLKNYDVVSEVENIYANPIQLDTRSSYRLLDLSHSVHHIFSKLPTLLVGPAIDVPSTYLFWRQEGGGVITLRLTHWQRDLWADMVSNQGATVDVWRHIEPLFQQNIDSLDAITSAVNKAAETFGKILYTEGKQDQDQYHALANQY